MKKFVVSLLCLVYCALSYSEIISLEKDKSHFKGSISSWGDKKENLLSVSEFSKFLEKITLLKKGEFEKKDAYEKRFIAEKTKINGKYVMFVTEAKMEYDADAEEFAITYGDEYSDYVDSINKYSSTYGDFKLKYPIAGAEAFKESGNKIYLLYRVEAEENMKKETYSRLVEVIMVDKNNRIICNYYNPMNKRYESDIKKNIKWMEADGKEFLIKDGKVICDYKIMATAFTEGLIPMYKNSKYGYVDKSGKEVIEAKYKDASLFSEGVAAIKIKGKYGYIDKSGKEVIKPKYDYCYNFNEGVAIVNIGGENINEDEYEDSGSYSAVTTEAAVMEDESETTARTGKYGYIDNTTESAVMVEKSKTNTTDGTEYKRGGKYGYIDKSGKEITNIEYDEIGTFSEGLAWFKKDGLYGYIDKSGKEVIEAKYEDAYSFSEDRAIVYMNGKAIVIDKSGKEILESKYDVIGTYSEGMALVYIITYNEENEEKTQICGFIDKNGKEIIPLKYSNASLYSDGLAAVCKDNKCGYIDKNGKEVIKIKYDSVTDFNEGVAIVESNGKKMYIDKSGKKVINKEFEDAGNFIGEYAVAKKDGKIGLIDKKGNWIIEPDFEEISLDEDMVIFKVSESYFMLPFEEVKK